MPERSFHKPRHEYDADITFSMNILMDRFRGLAASIETMGEYHGENERRVKDIMHQIYWIADSARHLADEGDLLASFAADELNAAKGKTPAQTQTPN